MAEKRSEIGWLLRKPCSCSFLLPQTMEHSYSFLLLAREIVLFGTALCCGLDNFSCCLEVAENFLFLSFSSKYALSKLQDQTRCAVLECVCTLWINPGHFGEPQHLGLGLSRERAHFFCQLWSAFFWIWQRPASSKADPPGWLAQTCHRGWCYPVLAFSVLADLCLPGRSRRVQVQMEGDSHPCRESGGLGVQINHVRLHFYLKYQYFSMREIF